MKKILVIEDDIDLLENIAEFLIINDFEVLLAKNGQEGKDIILKNKLDLIICDIAMPIMDGYQLFQELQKEITTSVIPFIFLTAKAEINDIRKGMTLGADDYIVKPFAYSDLLDSINTRLTKQEKLQNHNSTQPKKENIKIISELTNREKEIIKYFSQNLTCKEIGDILNISFHTVDSHRKNIEKKLQLKSISAIVKFAIENNIGR